MEDLYIFIITYLILNIQLRDTLQSVLLLVNILLYEDSRGEFDEENPCWVYKVIVLQISASCCNTILTLCTHTSYPHRFPTYIRRISYVLSRLQNCLRPLILHIQLKTIIVMMMMQNVDSWQYGIESLDDHLNLF